MNKFQWLSGNCENWKPNILTQNHKNLTEEECEKSKLKNPIS